MSLKYRRNLACLRLGVFACPRRDNFPVLEAENCASLARSLVPTGGIRQVDAHRFTRCSISANDMFNWFERRVAVYHGEPFIRGDPSRLAALTTWITRDANVVEFFHRSLWSARSYFSKVR